MLKGGRFFAPTAIFGQASMNVFGVLDQKLRAARDMSALEISVPEFALVSTRDSSSRLFSDIIRAGFSSA
jgi:hypothetical protein